MNYFEHPYVSNSGLSRLLADITPKDQLTDIKEAYKIGTLVDAFATEPDKVDFYNRVVVGQRYIYTEEELALGQRMRDQLMKDTFSREFIQRCKFQTEYYSPWEPFYFNGVEFKLHIKCKYDLDAWDAFAGGDIKSTAATTQDGFLKACRNFGYLRSRYFYMRNSGYERDIIIGISKKRPHNVFKIFIKKDDPLYMEGKHECHELAYKYWATHGCPDFIG